MVSQAKDLIQRSDAIQRFDHSLSQGELREAFVHRLMEPLLTSDYLVASGKIISAFQEVSPQLDCIISDRRIIPPFLIDGRISVVPIEAALMTVEVKTTLDAVELRNAHEAAAKVRNFKHAVPPGAEIEHVVPFLFAFGTDLKEGGPSEIARYKKIYQDGEPMLKAICVVGRGFWFWAKSRWHQYRFLSDHSEIVGFATSVVNVHQRISATRRRPDLQEYLGWNPDPIVGATVAQWVTSQR